MDAFWWGAQAALGAVAALVALGLGWFAVAFVWAWFFSPEAREERAHRVRRDAEIASRRRQKGIGAPREGYYLCDECDRERKSPFGVCACGRR